jgi:outer membrane protein assembly factor BamB
MTEPQPSDNATDAARPGTGYVVGMSAGTAAAVLALAVGTLAVAEHVRNRRSDPLNSVELIELKARLAANPRDRDLKKEIRDLDLRLREEHFGHLTLARWGNYALVGCVVVFLIGVRSAMACAAGTGFPRGKGADVGQEMRATMRGRRTVIALAVLLAAGAISPVAIEAYVRLTTVPPPPPHFADPKLVSRYWTQFRGPGGQGVSAYTNVPTEWDANSGRNILWKAEVPLGGKGSPVVWGDRVFLTGATRDERQVFCYAAGTGKLLWTGHVRDVPGSPARATEAFEDTGYAASTPVVDDRHVFAIFANGDLACFDFDGKMVWAKGLGNPNNQYSHGSSLVMYRSILLVLWDQGALEDYMSRLLAFDGETGRMRWQVRRPVSSSWATPVLVHDGGKDQLITSANPWVLSYDPAGGQEIWRAKCMEGGDVASTPAFAEGVVYAVCAETRLWAVRADGAGDVTDTPRVLWSADEGLPDLTSPLTNGRIVWLLGTGGTLTCYDAATGKKLYEHDLEMVFNASPSLVGDKLYLFSTKGVASILDAGAEYRLLRTNHLGEAVYASPAFQDGRIYIRGKKHLYCIAKADG